MLGGVVWMVDGGFFFFCPGVRFLSPLPWRWLPLDDGGIFSLVHRPFLHFLGWASLICISACLSSCSAWSFWWLWGASLRVFWAKVFWSSISFSNLLRTLT